MYCPNCGAELKYADAEICPTCGVRIKEPPVPKEPLLVKTLPSNRMKDTSCMYGCYSIIIIFTCLFMLVIIIAGITNIPKDPLIGSVMVIFGIGALYGAYVWFKREEG